MRPYLVIAVIALSSACTRKAEEDRPQPVAEVAQPVAEGEVDQSCAVFGVTMRSLAFRKTIGVLAKTVPAECVADYQRRLDALSESLWVVMDCRTDETRDIYTVWQRVPDATRSNPDTFPQTAPTGDGGSSAELRAFLEAAAPIITTMTNDLLARMDAMGDGGCSRTITPLR